MDERKRQKIGGGALPPPHSAVPQSEQFDGDSNRERRLTPGLYRDVHPLVYLFLFP